MYVRNGKEVPQHEEGAAFFEPISGPEEPQVWGVPKSLLTTGVLRGMGADAYDPAFAKSLVPSDAQAAADSGTTTLPEITIEGDPNADAPFYESNFYRMFALFGAGIGAYHGYKRNESVGWAIGWALLGSIFPIVVIPVAFAQGLGKRKGR